MSQNELNLGQIITTAQYRDAIHVAVAPVKASRPLFPGQRIGFIDRANSLVAESDNPIGIVDPFLQGSVPKDAEFWMFLFPGTITGLRHDWTHPAFSNAPSAQQDEKAHSEAWLRQASIALGIEYEDILSDSFALFNGDYINNGETIRNRWYDMEDEFLKHYSIVTGRTVTPDDVTGGFTCSC